MTDTINLETPEQKASFESGQECARDKEVPTVAQRRDPYFMAGFNKELGADLQAIDTTAEATADETGDVRAAVVDADALEQEEPLELPEPPAGDRTPPPYQGPKEELPLAPLTDEQLAGLSDAFDELRATGELIRLVGRNDNIAVELVTQLLDPDTLGFVLGVGERHGLQPYIAAENEQRVAIMLQPIRRRMTVEEAQAARAAASGIELP